MSNDRGCAAGDGDFGNHVVVGITQERTPQEEDVLPLTRRAKVVDDCEDVRLALASGKVTQEGSLVLKDERNRNSDFERAISKMLQQSERCGSPRTPTRDEDRRVEDDQH